MNYLCNQNKLNNIKKCVNNNLGCVNNTLYIDYCF